MIAHEYPYPTYFFRTLLSSSGFQSKFSDEMKTFRKLRWVILLVGGILRIYQFELLNLKIELRELKILFVLKSGACSVTAYSRVEKIWRSTENKWIILIWSQTVVLTRLPLSLMKRTSLKMKKSLGQATKKIRRRQPWVLLLHRRTTRTNLHLEDDFLKALQYKYKQAQVHTSLAMCLKYLVRHSLTFTKTYQEGRQASNQIKS